MLQTTWKGERLSRLMLGTVQFGMPYGIANRTGQPGYQEVLEIVTAALEGGVHCFDTAAVYGESEAVLGRVFRELNVVDDVFVVTKVPPVPPADARAAIRSAVAESRRRLGISCLPVVLFHREEDAVYLDELEDLRQRGWLRHLGVSCGNLPESARQLAGGGVAEALQVPANLLDRRHLQSGLLEDARQSQIAVFVRSVFLQGLLLMPEAHVRSDLQDAVAPRRQLQAMADDAGMSLQEMALRFIASLPGTTSVVVGVDCQEQFQSNLAAINKGPLDTELVQALIRTHWSVSVRTITPHLWE